MYFVYSIVISSGFQISLFSINMKGSIDIFINEISMLFLWILQKFGFTTPYNVKCQTAIDDEEH